MTEEMLEAALEYGRHGIPVFPCRGKKPLTLHGLKDATTDEVKIKNFWHQYPEANIGAATGAVSGFFAIDLDGDEGIASAKQLALDHQLPTHTPKQKTGGGGYHYLYRMNGIAQLHQTFGSGAKKQR